jgi:hypothetical protein
MFLQAPFIFIILTFSAFALGQNKDLKEDKHVKASIADHQKMAKAHSDAAQCLTAGKSEKVCHEALRAACPDSGIGKYCGMKHRH